MTPTTPATATAATTSGTTTSASTGFAQYGNATTEEFIALAEELSGRQLDEVFEKWIFSTGKPATAPGSTSVQARGVVPTEPKSFRQIQANHNREI